MLKSIFKLLSLGCILSGSSYGAIEQVGYRKATTFDIACTTILNNADESISFDSLQVKTLKRIAKQYRQHKGITNVSELPSSGECFDIHIWGFENAKLDLSSMGSVSLGLVSKLQYVAALDVSGNALQDNDVVFLNNVDGWEISNLFEDSLIDVNLSNNRIEAKKGFKFFTKFKRLKRLDLSGNDIQEVNDETFTGELDLDYLDLSRNKQLDYKRLNVSINVAYLDVSEAKSVNLLSAFSLPTFYEKLMVLQAAKTELTFRPGGMDLVVDSHGVSNLLYLNLSGTTVAEELRPELERNLVRGRILSDSSELSTENSEVSPTFNHLSIDVATVTDCPLEGECAFKNHFKADTYHILSGISYQGSIEMDYLGVSIPENEMVKIPSSWKLFL